MKTVKSLWLIPILIVVNGCSNLSYFDKGQLISTGLSAAAGYIGYQASEGRPRRERLLITGAAAGGAYLASELVRGKINAEYIEEFNRGYELGRSNSIKTQYWIIQNRQKEDESSGNPKSEVRYYEFPGVTKRRGINYAPHQVIMRIEE